MILKGLDSFNANIFVYPSAFKDAKINFDEKTNSGVFSFGVQTVSLKKNQNIMFAQSLIQKQTNNRNSVHT